MSVAPNVADILSKWAAGQPSVHGLVLIGSKVRSLSDTVWAADDHSDWDFQIITSHPRMFLDSDWTAGLDGLEKIAYAARTARIGGVPKINLLFSRAEADLVVLPLWPLRLLGFACWLGLHNRSHSVRRKAEDLALIIRPGWRFLKGAQNWEAFYRRIVSEVHDPRLSDDDLRCIADGFVCDYVSILRKIDRGEFIAAQRLIHRDLAETNLRLMHELRLRQGKRSFPEGRRFEMVASPNEVDALSVSALVEGTAQRAALRKAAATCRDLLYKLVGENWHWPTYIA